MSEIKNDFNTSKEAIENDLKIIQELYLSDDIPWVIGYSGGKDSTAALQLVWMAIEQLPKKDRNKALHIINTDTLVESPIVSKWVRKSIDAMESAAKNKELNIHTHVLKPKSDNTFWVNFIGRGYPFPRKKFRWCTSRMKIDPVNDFIQNKIAEHGEIILVLGTRKQESASRQRHMEALEKKRVRELLSPNPTLANELVYSPLEDWSNDDVWSFLMQYKNPWDYSNDKLLTLYRGATKDNECPMMTDKDLNLPSCGKSRFGCWVCTMVSKDVSMEQMINNDPDKEWLTPLLEFRDEFGDELKDRERREFRKRKGYLQGGYQRLYHGPYKKEWREYWLRRVLEVQEIINQTCPDEFKGTTVITIEELRAIRRIWVRRNHEFDDSLPRIYKEVTGKNFDDPTWISLEMFGQDEFELLKEVCNELYGDEELLFEMMYNLVYLENKAASTNERHKLLEQLEGVMRKTFYKNEEDAKDYYMSRIERKRDYDVEYNELALKEYGKSDKQTYDTEITEGDELHSLEEPMEEEGE